LFAFPAKVNGSSVNYVYTKPATLAAGLTITLQHLVMPIPTILAHRPHL